MLILTRRVGETVMIGNDVTVTVLGVKGNQVRVGVNAPRDVAVHREEIFERIKREEQDGTTARTAPATTAMAGCTARTANSSHAGTTGMDRRTVIRLTRVTRSGRPEVKSGQFPAPSFTGRLRTFILRGSPKNGEMAEWSKARPC